MNTVTQPLTGNRCECGGCHQRFNSVSAFDLHRTGIHGVDRHCREPSEMLAIGMRLNEQGFWIERRRQERYQKRRPRAQEARSALAPGHGQMLPMSAPQSEAL
jgi:hypothetical protein